MIKICCDHQQEQETPLIYTFCFPGKELWCPYCGRTFMFFDDLDERNEELPEGVDQDTPLEAVAKAYKKHYRRFLRSAGILIGGGKLRFHGRWITFDSLSERTKEALTQTIEQWPKEKKYDDIKLLPMWKPIIKG